LQWLDGRVVFTITILRKEYPFQQATFQRTNVGVVNSELSTITHINELIDCSDFVPPSPNGNLQR
jgi:hypothetical protein